MANSKHSTLPQHHTGQLRFILDDLRVISLAVYKNGLAVTISDGSAQVETKGSDPGSWAKAWAAKNLPGRQVREFNYIIV